MLRTSMNKELRDQITRILEELDLPQVEFTVEHPALRQAQGKLQDHGDYATNVAMVLAKKVGRDPIELAKKIADKLTGYDKVDVAGPGFINISINSDYFVSELERVLKNASNYGKGELWQGKRIVVEYTDPNPFKEFHIGHLYNTSVGETLARLFEFQGAKVWRADFFGDVGMHAAKALWGLARKFQFSNSNFQTNSKFKTQKFKIDEAKWKELAEKPLPERVKVMGQAYAMGATAYEEDEKAKEEMKRLNLLIFVAAQEYWQETKGWKPRVDYRSHVQTIDEEELQEVKKLWVTGRQWSLDYFETLYERMGTKIDGYYPESLTGEWGYDFVMQGLKSGVFEKSEGAVVYKGEKHGFHTRVFINKLGLPTYETKDIGNAPMKMHDFAYDKSLIVTGGEIIEYFKVVIAAMKEVNPELGNKTEHLGHGMVRLPEGKMSSRTGKIVTGEWLLDEARGRVNQIISKPASPAGRSDNQLTEAEQDKIAVGAVKYAFLKSGIGKDIAFSFDESVSFEGNSGPYLQYTYARCRSVLRRANEEWKMKNEKLNSQFSILNSQLNAEEMAVLRWIPRYGEVIEQACKEYAPSHVCTYLYELAQRFNSFYNKHSILGGSQDEHVAGSTWQVAAATSYEPQATRQFRLALTAATAQVIKNGLNVLGIRAPNKM